MITRCVFLYLLVSALQITTQTSWAQNIRAFNLYCNAYEGKAGKINEGVSSDRLFINELLNDQISEASWGVKVIITELKGKQATKANMLKNWSSFAKTVQPNDTVFTYFSGHGAIARQNGPQVLAMCDQTLINRDEWSQMVDSLNCRLKVLITDCCSSYSEIVVAEGDEEVTPWSNLYHLLMLHEGFVNITAASPGEAAWATQVGSYLTINLHSDMQRYKTWQRVFEETKKRVILETSEAIGVKQTPLAYSLGRYKGSNSIPASVSYVIPDSDRRNLSRAELSTLGLQQLYLARNEIAARHGYDFSTPLLRKYFSAQSWYRKQAGKKDYQLSKIESRNVDLIRKVEFENGGPFIRYVDPASQNNFVEIFPHSSRKSLPRTAVQTLSRPQLSIARNEIYARHGYPFKSKTLANYFARNPKYRRASNAMNPRLNEIERQNLWLIRKMERINGGAFQW